MASTLRKIAISTGGGDAPGLNAVIRAVALTALERGMEAWGIAHGYRGLLAHDAELSVMADTEARVDRLCELNVVEQVGNVARTTIVQDAWRRGQPLELHGWIYGLKDGLLRDLNVPVAPLRDRDVNAR